MVIGLIVTLATIGGGLVFAVIIGVFALIQTGRIATPNSPQKRVQHAKIETQIAELELRRSEARREMTEHNYKTAQTEANRQIMEARTIEELQRIQEEGFRKALGTGDQPAPDVEPG